jgi:GH15 family glucan-1,4-alpha-glucosidase
MDGPFARISDYGLIGNCRTAALVSRQGSIDWCCFPKFDSPSYFARLLDQAGGHFSIAPSGACESRQTYLEGTNVLETRFKTAGGTAGLLDLFSVKDPRFAPDQLWPDQEILRILEGEQGECEFDLEFSPRCRYGKDALDLGWVGDWGLRGQDARKLFLLQSSLPKGKLELVKVPGGHVLRAKFSLRKGERVVFSLAYADEAPAVIPPLQNAMGRLEQTIHYWRSWSSKGRFPETYRGLVQRSALALKLLNFAPSGAFVAAPTTSLPENPGGSRNWDYRYCWLRDASFTTRALLRLGYIDEARAFLNWLLHSTRLSWPRLQVLYSVYGESRIQESEAPWLSGYQNSRPVRLGNEASSQLQLDVYGEVIDSFYALSEHLDSVDRDTRKMVVGFGNAVSRLWRLPDRGIWEFRSVARHYVHSKLMCWVAMDRLEKLSHRYGWRLPYDPGAMAAEIRSEIEAHGYDPEMGSYTRAFGEPFLDSSLLVMPLMGYCRADSPRYRATCRAIIAKLGTNQLLHRYPAGSDGFPEREGTFTLCNFWLAEVMARAGETGEARKWFDSVADRLAPTGLSSEEMDPEQGSYLGNHPQGFSHIGLINAALAIDRARMAA